MVVVEWVVAIILAWAEVHHYLSPLLAAGNLAHFVASVSRGPSLEKFVVSFCCRLDNERLFHHLRCYHYFVYPFGVNIIFTDFHN